MSNIRVTVGGVVVTHNFDPTTLEIPTRADMGEANSGSLLYEDEGATLTLTGHQPVEIEEIDCTTQPRIFTGWTTQRDIKRDPPNAMLAGPNARVQQLNIVELNGVFDFRQITRTGTGGGNRPSETWADRLTWILESEYLSDWLPANQDFVVTNTTMMDEADYRSQTPRAVMQDLSERSGDAYTFFAFFDPISNAIRLFFDNPSSYIAASTISISDVLGDVGGLCFAPDSEATLAREPDEVYSDVILEYFDGTLKLYRSRPSTYATYERRGASIQRPYTKSLATATSQAEKWLDKHAVETDRITCSIQVPAASVGLIQAGQSISVKFSHMPGYETFTMMRVVSCSPKPIDDTGYWYTIALELVGVVTPITEGAYAVLTWQSLDETVDPGHWAYVPPPYKPRARHNGNFPHVGDTGQWTTPLTGPLQYVASDGTTPAPGPYVPGIDADAGYGIKCLADGVLDVEFALTAIQVYMTSFTIAIYVNGVSVASAVDVGGEATVTKTGLVVASGDVIEGWIVNQTNAYVGEVLIPSGVGSASREHLKVSGIMGGGGGSDVIVPLPPAPGSTTTHTTDPTVNDDAAAGYTVGSTWINTTDGGVFVLVDSTTGAAVWVETSPVAGTVYAPTTADYLVGTAQAGLSAEIVVGTTPGGELGGTWASPTVDATHSGSAHLALGSTSSTAAAGDHTHVSGGELLVADGTTGPSGITPTSYVEMTTPDTTTSGTLEDITGATTTITLQRTSHIAAWLNLHVSATAACDYGVAINFNGTDEDEGVIHLTATDEGNVGIVHRTTTELPPGTYTFKGRHRRISGGGTPETDRADLLVMAMGLSGPVMLTNDDETDYLYADT